MKKIVIKLPKGLKYKLKETESTIEINIELELWATIKSKEIKVAAKKRLARPATTGKFVVRKKASKRTKVTAHKRHGTGGTGPRKK